MHKRFVVIYYFITNPNEKIIITIAERDISYNYKSILLYIYLSAIVIIIYIITQQTQNIATLLQCWVIIYLYGPLPDFNNSHICYQNHHSE